MASLPENDRIAGFEVHPFANIFPMFGEEELEELRSDIEKNGLVEPIVLYGGKILDGRNRAKVCEMLGIKPQTVEYTGNDPLAFVVSKNLRRRHLRESQRAMAAARLANMRHGGVRKNQAANLPLDGAPPVTQAKAAEKLNVSERSVRDAHVVLNSGNTEVIEAVESGKEPVSAAANKIRADKKEVQRKKTSVKVEQMPVLYEMARQAAFHTMLSLSPERRGALKIRHRAVYDLFNAILRLELGENWEKQLDEASEKTIRDWVNPPPKS